MLKALRIILATLSFVAVTLLFLDFTGTARSLWPWMAKIQFMPAVLSANFVVIAALIVLTLIFGRVYCSVICPLGIIQDMANWLRGRVGNKKKRKNRLAFTPASTKLRLVVLTIFVVLVIAGLTTVLAAAIAGLLEPYSAYGRIASQIFAPIYDFFNNLLAGWSESHDNYTFYRVSAAISAPVLIVAIITLVTVLVLAWTGGRDYCNKICPVGTILGYLSKFSLLKPVIFTDKCVGCKKCARRCKAKCIDAKNHAIDYSRCVACMDCISTCKEGAIKYTWRRPATTSAHNAPSTDCGRRSFMAGAGLVVGTLAYNAAAKTTDGGLTALKGKRPHKRATRVVPPGAVSIKHLKQHCTACQLCIQACPNHILKPTVSLDGFMQPTMDFTDGYCTPECTVCSNICPDGALHPIDKAQKSSIKVGTAVVDLDACISAHAGQNCGSCVRHCPVSAIQMVTRNPDGSGHLMPVVDESTCIGCGSCEYHCPVGSVATMKADSSAIHIEGIEIHRSI